MTLQADYGATDVNTVFCRSKSKDADVMENAQVTENVQGSMLARNIARNNAGNILLLESPRDNRHW